MVLVLVAAGLITFGATHRGALPVTGGQPVAQPASEGDGDVAGTCGKERWAVKTGTDGRAASVDLSKVADTTIAALRSLPAPSEEDLSTHGFDRLAPVELTVYRLHATAVEFKRETDSDYHVVVADERGHTMIVEIPLPSCVGSTSPFRAQVAAARASVDAAYPDAERQASFRRVDRAVTVTGVGFFDFPHGQTGVAPNAVELHPVLSIAFG